MTNLTIEPMTGQLGALVTGPALADQQHREKLTPALHDALLKHKVLFLRDQPMEVASFAHLGACFGETEAHHYYLSADGSPEVSIIESNTERSTTDNVWHTDGVYRQTPPKFGLLQAMHVPEKGGDTIWADMTACYYALSPKLQAMLRSLRAVHDVAGGYGDRINDGLAESSQLVHRTKLPPIEHPVVRTHPITQEPILYVNPTYTTQIVGLPKAESNALLAMLFGLIATPEYQVRFKWEPFSIAIWDNRNTLHYAVADYAPRYRKMHRVSVKGDIPV